MSDFSSEDYLARQNELIENPTARVPVALCLDVSGSVQGAPLDELNAGIAAFYDAIREDETAVFAAEIAIVTFGGMRPRLIEDFATLEKRPRAPLLSADGATPLGEGVNLALDRLEERKEQYRSKGVDYYQPWLVLMTDGAPNGSVSELQRAIGRVSEMVTNRKLTIFPIGIGKHADMGVLSRFSPGRQPFKLKGLCFREFFAWLSQSVSRVSQSMPGEDFKPVDMKGWQDLD